MNFPSSSLYDENYRLWSSYSHNGPQLLQAVKAKGKVAETQICRSATGDDNLRCERDGGEIYLHSQGDPKREAEDWFKKVELAGISVLSVYGIGLGYYYDAAKEWLDQDPNRTIVFFEDDPAVFDCFLSTERCNRLLNDPQALLFFFHSNDISLYTELAMMYGELLHRVSCLKSYFRHKNETYHQFKSALDFFTTMTGKNLYEFFNHGLAFYRNYILNILNIPKSKFGNRLLGNFQGVPAIICGAGPSLSDNGKVLAELSDRALIFAGGTGMNALNAVGVVPHFGVGIDPNLDQYTRLIMNSAFETPFFYRCRMLNEALNVVHGERLYLTGSGGYEISKWFENKFGIVSEEFAEGYNVLTFSVMIAKLMGCNPIVCAGIDLAYSKGQSYAEGIVNHPLHNLAENFKTKGIDEDLLTHLDIYGKPVHTLWKWLAESLWYAHFSANNPECRLINATEGGIGFHDVQNLSLEEVKDLYLQKEFDIAGRLHGEIEMARLPAILDEKRVMEAIGKLADSLEACAMTCHEIEAKQIIKAKDPLAGEAIDREIEALQEELHNEEAYGAILKSFNETFSKRSELRMRLRDFRRPGLTDEEKAKMTALSESAKMNHLKTTAALNAKLIKEHLKNYQEQMALQAPPGPSVTVQLPSPSKKETYVYSEGSFRLIDPELGIHFSEEGGAGQREILNYPSGALKMETFYKDGRIHGPSRFYDETGNLLSEAWFINGKREGKMWTYHLGGSLHSLRLFRDGRKEGVHQYFYADGSPRSVLPYRNDLLSGLVILYHPDGVLGRRLTFVDGIRDGLEEIWDSHGRRVIEARFLAGKPVGTAKEWYADGSLAKEVIYNEYSHLVDKKAWDRKGNPVRLVVKDDFFDQVNAETAHLTAALGDMVKKMGTIVPGMALKEKLENAAGAEGGIEAQLTILQKEMARLEEIGHCLEAWQAVDPSKPAEALWKNPETRQMIEKQLKARSKGMNDDMAKMKKGIKGIIEKLKDQKKEGS